MPTVQEDILNAFCARLVKSASMDAAAVEALRKALASGKKLKADEVVAMLQKDQPGGSR